MKKRKKEQTHVPLPKETRAYFCAGCGAVSLDADSICKVQGLGTKGDWCGTSDPKPANPCRNRVHKVRWACENCGKVSVNAELLCEPRPLKFED